MAMNMGEARLLWRAEMVKEYGDKFIHTPDPTNARIPLVSPMLTWAMSGGPKIGHMCRWYGPEGSGKSLTNYAVIWAAQNYPMVVSFWAERRIKAMERRKVNKIDRAMVKKGMTDMVKRFPDGMDCVYYDTEQRFEAPLLEALGIDPARIEVVDNNTIEEILESAKKALTWCPLVFIDSATNAESIEVANTDAGGYTVGADARAWKRIRNVQKSFDRRYNTLIFVDQMRANLGSLGKGPMGPAAAPPNVRILRHRASLAAAYDKGKWLFLDKNGMLTDDDKKASNDFRALGRDGKEVAGIEMRCKIEKNSTGVPFRNARTRFCFPVADRRTGELVQEAGWDTSFEMLEMALHFDIMEVSGSRYYPLDENFEQTGDSYHGEAKARAAIMEDEEMYDRIIARVADDIR